MNTVPGGGSCSRGSRLISVDLPDPVAPTSATVCPASIRSETSIEDRLLAARIRERQVAELDRAVESRRARPAGGDVGVVDRPARASRTSSIRFQDAIPRCSMFVTQPNAIIGQLSITR